MDHVKLKLEGKLTGPWVTDLEECYRATSLMLAGRDLRVDLTAVGHIDSAGKYLLALLRGNGAALIASGAANVELVERIALDWPTPDKK